MTVIEVSSAPAVLSSCLSFRQRIRNITADDAIIQINHRTGTFFFRNSRSRRLPHFGFTATVIHASDAAPAGGCRVVNRHPQYALDRRPWPPLLVTLVNIACWNGQHKRMPASFSDDHTDHSDNSLLVSASPSQTRKSTEAHRAFGLGVTAGSKCRQRPSSGEIRKVAPAAPTTGPQCSGESACQHTFTIPVRNSSHAPNTVAWASFSLRASTTFDLHIAFCTFSY